MEGPRAHARADYNPPMLGGTYVDCRREQRIVITSLGRDCNDVYSALIVADCT